MTVGGPCKLRRTTRPKAIVRAPPPRLPEGAPGTRTYALVKAQDDARANPAYRPRGLPGKETTFCNQATCFIANRTGIPQGPLNDSRGIPLLANQQASELERPDSGFRQVSPTEAQSLANQGTTVIAVQPHSGHGHIATVRPDSTYFANYEVKDPNGSGPLMNHIGSRIGIFHESGAFLPAPPVRYYAPGPTAEPDE